MEFVPYLAGREVVEFVAENGPVTRVISAFEECDLLWASGLHPKSWHHPGWAALPNMAIRSANGCWAGVTGVNVGYLGAGPRKAEALLMSLGLDGALAAKIASFRFSDVRLDEPDASRFSQKWPYYQFGMPSFQQSGLYSLEVSRGGVAACLELLGDPTRPAWIGNRREVTYWLPGTRSGGAAERRYPLRIVQGDLELRIAVGASWEGVFPRLTGDAVTLLRELKCPTGQLDSLTKPAALSRLARFLTGQPQPEVVCWGQARFISSAVHGGSAQRRVRRVTAVAI